MGAARRRPPTVGEVELLAGLAVGVLGFLLHFTYEWSGSNPVVASFAPANESVWEHLKLVVTPVILLGALEARWVLDRRGLWFAKLAEIAVACALIVAFFYTYTGALGVHSVTTVDIASYLVAVAAGQWTSWRLISSGRRGPPLWASVAAMLLVVGGFVALTFVPPHVPLFQVTSTGAYGPT